MRDQITSALFPLLTTETSLAPQDRKRAFLDLLGLAQTVEVDEYLLFRVAGKMGSQARAAFGPLTQLLVMTEPGRRQVYFAVLAELGRRGDLSRHRMSAEGRSDLITRLLTLSDDALIVWAYGSCPPGYVRLIKNLGGRGSDPDLYTGLYALLSADPELGRSLPKVMGKKRIEPDLLPLLDLLPPGPDRAAIAKRFGTVVTYKAFTDLYHRLTGHPLTPEHRDRLIAGEGAWHLILSLLEAIQFDPPVVCLDQVRHLKNGVEMTEAARRFDNCLRGRIEKAVSGRAQYYVWTPVEGEEIVFSLKRDAVRRDGRFGWFLDEARTSENGRPPRKELGELKRLLLGVGVGVEPDTSQLLRSFRHLMHEHGEADADPEEIVEPDMEDHDEDFDQLVADFEALMLED